MTSLAAYLFDDWAAEPEVDNTPPRPARHGWAMIGDVGMCRGGVPEILIQWRRAQGEDDPRPQL